MIMSISVSKKFINQNLVEVTVSCQKRKISKSFTVQPAYQDPDVYEDVVIPRMTTIIDEIVSGCSEDACLSKGKWQNIRGIIFPREFEMGARITQSLKGGDF